MARFSPPRTSSTTNNRAFTPAKDVKSSFLCNRRPQPSQALAFSFSAHASDGSAPNDSIRHKLSSIVDTTRTFFTGVFDTMRHARVELIQASVSRALLVLLLNPVDLLKTRTQTSVLTRSKGLAAFCSSQPPLTGLLPSILSHASRLTLTYSFFSVFYDQFSTDTDNRKSTRSITLLAACAADTLSALIVSPLEVMKVRVQTGAAKNVLAACQQGNLLGHGLSTQILRDLPFRILFLVSLDAIRQRGKEQGKQITPWKYSVAAGAVAATAGAITNPVDVIRSRIMAQHMNSGKLYANWLHCAIRTVSQEGPQALFRGVVPRMVYLAVSAAAFMAVTDGVQRVTDEKLAHIASATNLSNSKKR